MTHQAIVLTYEGDAEDQLSTYLQRALWPVEPVYLFGRTAVRYPECKKREAVYHWWKEGCNNLSFVHFKFISYGWAADQAARMANELGIGRHDGSFLVRKSQYRLCLYRIGTGTPCS